MRVATALLLPLGAASAGSAAAAPMPAFAGTTVITARGNGGVVLSMPRRATLDTRGMEAQDYAVTIARRGGTYAFVGLSEPDACRRYADPETRMCMAVHGYDMGAMRQPGKPAASAQQVVTLDPPTVGQGRIEVYVLTDGEVTLTVRFKGLPGTRRVRADRRVTGWMRELPRTCAAACEDVAFGGATYDVGPAGFVAALTSAYRDVDGGTPTPLGTVDPGTQLADTCIYRASGAWGASPEPKDHPTGCDPAGDPLGTATTVANAPGSADPRNNASGWNIYDYGATGRVYVGFHGAVAGTEGRWRSLTAYGVWVSDGIR